MSDNIETYMLMRFSRRTGKIDTTLEAMGHALLELWALQNTPKTKDTIVFNKRDGEVVFYAEGRESGFPSTNHVGLGNIDDYCPGLLVKIQAQSN